MTRVLEECHSPFWGEATGQRGNARVWLDKCAITIPSVPWTVPTAFVTHSPEHKCNLCHTNFKMMMCIRAYKVISQTGNPKALLLSCIFTKIKNWSQFKFCHYLFPIPGMLILQTMKVNNVNSFIPGVNHDHVHISKSCNSVRAAGD